MAIMQIGPPRTGGGLAAGAALAVLTGAVSMAGTLVATPGPWIRGYVSETGTADQPFAAAYAVGGFALALGVALLGACLAPLARAAAALLAVAASMAAVSAAVPCSAGCPLPPYEAFTVADLVHTGAAMIGLAAVFVAMVTMAISVAVPPWQRRWAGGFAVAMLPLAVTEGLGMLLVGRGTLTAVVERVLLTVTACWLLGAAGLAAGSARMGPAGPAGWEISRRRHRPGGTP
jgi:hypothetical protein